MPAAKLIEAASTPQQAWRPPYWRDTGIGIGGSLLLALLAMWLVELFNRSEPQPSVVLVGRPSGGLQYEAAVDALPRQHASIAAVERAAPALLPSQPQLPRELGPDEVTALLRASDEDGRLLLRLLLSGITADEASALRWSDVDAARSRIRVGGNEGRDVDFGEDLRAQVAARGPAQDSDLLVRHAGQPATRESIDAQALCAAHDAGIEDPASVTADCLRHTYVAYLVRQGIRFADLSRLVGRLPAELLGAYSALAPPGPRLAGERIDTVLPGIRANGAGRAA
jgi:hypothetical protein